MITIGDVSNRCRRRDFLRIGSLALGGLSLDGLLHHQTAAAELGSVSKDKSVVFLFLHGGPSQTETFDPKMSAPAGVRSVTGEVKTTLPGVTFGASLPKLAALANQLAVVRSFTTGDGNHDIKPIVGRDTFAANLGAIHSRILGASHPQTGIPTNVALFPRAVDETTQAGNFNFGDFLATGLLSGAHAPFVPGTSGPFQQDMTLDLPLRRVSDRRALLSCLDDAKRQCDVLLQSNGIQSNAAQGTASRSASVDAFRQQAFDVLLGGVSKAFDLSREDPQTLARYDTAPLVRPENISRRWNNHKNYADNAKSLGKLMLLARRLCEAGCGFVTVTTNFVWDMHADQNNATMHEGMEYIGRPFDHAVSAFLEDVAARGLSEKILLVACGEMGRTPRLNDRGGRDHWGRLAPLLIAGGGLRMGQVIGRSDSTASEPATEPITIRNLLATVLHTAFDVGTLRVQRGLPREIAQQMTSWRPIEELI